MKIGIDVDGVLADFNSAYLKLLAALTHREMPRVSSTYPDQWGYDEALASAKELANAWQIITSPHAKFWEDLETLASYKEFTRLAQLQVAHEVYFVTSRPGPSAKQQTEQWLRARVGAYRQLFPCPTVLTSREKGAVCRGLRLNYFLDDNTENIEDIAYASPTTHSYLLDRPYNLFSTLPRVASVSEFLDKVEQNSI